MNASGDYPLDGRIHNDFSEYKSAESRDELIHEAFARVAKRFPHTIALSFAGKELSYGFLDCVSDDLAQLLLEMGVGMETVVGINAERSVELIVGMLAILKAGAAYLPLDPGYPREHLRYMLQDSGARLVLTRNEQSGSFSDFDV